MKTQSEKPVSPQDENAQWLKITTDALTAAAGTFNLAKRRLIVAEANFKNTKSDLHKAELEKAQAEAEAAQTAEAAARTELADAKEYVASLTAPPAPAIERPGILERFVRAIDIAFAREPKLTGMDLTCFLVIDYSGRKYFVRTEEELQAARELQRQHDKAKEIIAAHTPDLAKVAFTRHQQEVIQIAVQKGNMDAHEGYTISDWQEDFAAKLEAAKADQKRICREFIGMAQAIGERYTAIATGLANEREESEREFFERYGVPFQAPSRVVEEIRKSCAYIRARLKPSDYSSQSPREMCPFLDI